jgi:hypothetical protein
MLPRGHGFRDAACTSHREDQRHACHCLIKVSKKSWIDSQLIIMAFYDKNKIIINNKNRKRRKKK